MGVKRIRSRWWTGDRSHPFHRGKQEGISRGPRPARGRGRSRGGESTTKSIEPMLRSLPLLAALVVWLPGIAMAQSYGALKGEVILGDDTPVQGATIRVIGTTKGAITKADGKYVILGIAPGEYQVTVTRIGYELCTAKILILADTVVEMKAELRLRKVPVESWRPLCSQRGHYQRPLRPERMGTTHTISAEALENSPRPTLFGGGY